jgi:FixJ family two-component response regulator
MEPLDREVSRALDDDAMAFPSGPARILISGGDDRCQSSLLPALRERKHRCTQVQRLGEARAALTHDRYDVLLLSVRHPDGAGLDLLPAVQRVSPSTKVILHGEGVDQAILVRALRGGAVDYIDTTGCTVADFLDSVDAAVIKSRIDRQRERRVLRLKRVCQELNAARRQVNDQVDGLCRDLTTAYRDLSDQMNDVAMVAEFKTLLQQELDVEALLRTMLEYLLTKTGATNAAVFLPDHGQAFGLGAYVNYDCPRETVSVLLDHLCAAICPQMAEEDGLVLFEDAAEFAAWIGADAAILGDSQVMAFSCRHEGECMAVVVLFRGKANPYGPALGATIDLLRPVIARQLSACITVHHRATAEWPAEPREGEGEADRGDEFGFGYGDGLSVQSGLELGEQGVTSQRSSVEGPAAQGRCHVLVVGFAKGLTPSTAAALACPPAQVDQATCVGGTTMGGRA